MLKIDSCFAGGFWLKNFKWRDFHDDLWSNFCQKGKVSTGKAESCFRKRKFHPLFCFGHLMLTQTDLIFWTSRKRCNFSEMWRIHTTRYSVIFQKFPSRVRVVPKNPSSIRVAGTCIRDSDCCIHKSWTMMHVSMMHVSMMHVSLMHVSLMHVSLMHVSMMHISAMHISAMHVFLMHGMHISTMHIYPDPWSWYMCLWCTYAWCIYPCSLILIHACMMHISVFLNPWLWCMCVYDAHIYDPGPRSWSMHVCMVHVSTVSYTHLTLPTNREV